MRPKWWPLQLPPTRPDSSVRQGALLLLSWAMCASAMCRTYCSKHNNMDNSIARYREKRLRRTFDKTIRYQTRKNYAETRPRIKGRFARKDELEAMAAAGLL